MLKKCSKCQRVLNVKNLMHVGVTGLNIYLLLMIIEEIVFVKIVSEKRLVNQIYKI